MRFQQIRFGLLAAVLAVVSLTLSGQEQPPQASDLQDVPPPQELERPDYSVIFGTNRQLGPVQPNVADTGTHGDVFMTSPAPYSNSGVLLQAQPTWPNVSVKVGSASGAFSVFDSSDRNLFNLNGASLTLGIGGGSSGTSCCPGRMLLQTQLADPLPVPGTPWESSGAWRGVIITDMWYSTMVLRVLHPGTTGGIGVAQIATDYPGRTLSFATGLFTEAMFIDGSQRVGIGTRSVGSRLSLTPTTTESKITLWDGGSTTAHYGFGVSTNQLNYHVAASSDNHIFYAGGKNGNGTLLMAVKGTGKVGIGTPAPGAGLHISGTNPTLLIDNSFDPAADVSWSGIGTRGPSGGSYQYRWSTGRPGNTSLVTANAFELYEYPDNTSVPCCRQRLSIRSSLGQPYQPVIIDGAGNLGVGGAVNSAYRLYVTGDANFTGTVTGGNIQAKYQDVAEWVPSVESLSPGTVVTLDRRHVNHVVASTHPYDTAVAGVVSAQPGLILGEASASKAMIATTGRVRVRVDASRGPIAIGDLLVTSDKSGIAMKSTPIDFQGIAMHRPGTVVGKALEPLAAGEGEILVLLSLQ